MPPHHLRNTGSGEEHLSTRAYYSWGTVRCRPCTVKSERSEASRNLSLEEAELVTPQTQIPKPGP